MRSMVCSRLLCLHHIYTAFGKVAGLANQTLRTVTARAARGVESTLTTTKGFASVSEAMEGMGKVFWGIQLRPTGSEYTMRER